MFIDVSFGGEAPGVTGERMAVSIPRSAFQRRLAVSAFQILASRFPTRP
jgi:hypothetical protein